MGIGTVFFGLICLVLITMAVSAVCKSSAKPQTSAKPLQSAAPVAEAAAENKQEIIAASCAVIAEELGTDANNIRVTSFKKL